MGCFRYDDRAPGIRRRRDRRVDGVNLDIRARPLRSPSASEPPPLIWFGACHIGYPSNHAS